MSTTVKKQGWIRRLVGYMKPHKKNAYIAFGVAIGGQLIQSLLPVVQKIVVDDVITPHSRNGHHIPGKPLAPWLALMIAMGVFTFVFAYFRRFRGGRIALDVQHDLRTAIFRQLQRLDFASHDELQTGQLVSRVVRRRAPPGLLAVHADRRRQHLAVHRLVRGDALALAAALARDARGRAAAARHRDEAAHVGVPRRAGTRSRRPATSPTWSRKT